MTTPPPLWGAAGAGTESDAFTADLQLQPRWDIPEKIAIIAGEPGRTPASAEDYRAPVGQPKSGR